MEEGPQNVLDDFLASISKLVAEDVEFRVLIFMWVKSFVLGDVLVYL